MERDKAARSWRGRRRGGVMLWACLALLAPLRAAAVHAEEPRTVSVAMTDGAPVDPALWASLRELFARIGVGLVESAPEDRTSALSVRLSARPDGTVIMVTGERLEPIERRVERNGSEDLERETVAHVILGIIEPLVETGAMAAARPEEPAPAPPPEPTQTDSLQTPVAARFGLYGGPVWLSARTVAPRVGASAGLVWDRGLQPSLTMDGAFAWKSAAASDRVHSHLGLLSLRVRAGASIWRSARFALEMALPLGVDAAFLGVDSVPPGARARANSLRFDPMLGGAITGRLHLGHGLALTLTAAADVDLTPRRWLVNDGGHQETQAELARLRPYLSLGVTWDALKPTPKPEAP